MRGLWPAFPSASLNAVLRHRSRTNVSRPRRRRRGRARYHKNEYTKRPHEVRVAHALSLRSVLAAGLLPARLIPGSRPWYVYLVSGAGGAPHDGTRQHARVARHLAGDDLGLASCVWMMSLTRSIGAVHVLAMAPEMPPARKSVTNEPPMASALCPACAVVRVRRAAASSSRGAAGRAPVGQTTCGGVWYRRAGGARRAPYLHG